MREFLRGGYRDLDETTVVSSHGRPVFTVLPYQTTAVHALRVDPMTGVISDPLDDQRLAKRDPSPK